ncbi:MAG TPA: restriction endonuclease [Acidovorax sp.]|jgi:restriction system protein|nr:restriction endonuclease [Acidovorax sp.]
MNQAGKLAISNLRACHSDFNKFHEQLKILFTKWLPEAHARIVHENFEDFALWFDIQKRQFIDEFTKPIMLKNEERVKSERADILRLEMEKFLRCLSEMVDKHRIALSAERRKTIRKDAYGMEIGYKKWVEHVRYFTTKVVTIPEPLDFSSFDFVSFIDNLLLRENENEGGGGHPPFDEKMTGLDFEAFCEGELIRLGWSVFRTSYTGDQGVDLIASLGFTRVAIQCKRYSAPVGNQAIQEIAAGMKYESCDHGVVVTTSSFTRSAIALADANRVVLIHFSQLNKLAELLGLQNSRK